MKETSLLGTVNLDIKISTSFLAQVVSCLIGSKHLQMVP